ncbi:hypothetical protein [uncultured Hydrogenophaga sp.]|uniref:hypothetical protein n=1 Tax=uncultured Hydrogenophaga sp. TaxID=199683 RepID=UPI00265F677B|nr:hypothetical protein [uncultured Hydrogenophaga sp.]
MRTLAIVLLMLLMPLRAWAGDAMALSMLHGQGHPPVTSTASMAVETEDHAGHADHDDHASMAEPDNHCSSHTACDLCNGPVLSLPGWKADPVPARHHLQTVPKVRFASLVPPRHHKPPIS